MEVRSYYLAEGTVLDNRYIIKRVLGAGGFGVTYQAYDNLNHFDCAIKEYLPRDVSVRDNTMRVIPAAEKWREEFEQGRKRFINEADTLKKIRGCKSIVNITDYFDENNTSYFVMEYIDGVNLNHLKKTYGGRIPYKIAVDIILQVCDGLSVLHEREGIFHRDISPENIMIEANGTVKLIDFGSAKNISMQKGFSVVLKQGFAPLEQYSSKGIQGAYTDVYALAATLYYILAGQMIPNAPERQSGMDYIPLKVMPIGVPEYVSDAVDKALELNYQNRVQTAGGFKILLQESQIESSVHITGKKTPFLLITKGENAGNKHIIPVNTPVRVGRSKQMADICLGTNQKISRVHCQVFFDADKALFYLKDCSVNGIYVDGRGIDNSAPCPLEPGRRFVLGNYACEIELGVMYENNTVKL